MDWGFRARQLEDLNRGLQRKKKSPPWKKRKDREEVEGFQTNPSDCCALESEGGGGKEGRNVETISEPLQKHEAREMKLPVSLSAGESSR